MNPMIEQAKQEDIPVYLETDTPENVSLYEYKGFEIYDTYHLPNKGPMIWLMKREA